MQTAFSDEDCIGHQEGITPLEMYRQPVETLLE
jgi:hypothetical protein